MLPAQAEVNKKITADQPAKIKDFWTAHHAQFIKTRIVERLLKVKDGTKLDAFLTNAVSAGKITAYQVAHIKALWTELHSTQSNLFASRRKPAAGVVQPTPGSLF